MRDNNEIVVANDARTAGLAIPEQVQDRESVAIVLRRRWRTMLIVWLIAGAVALGGVATFVRPQYKVSAALHVAPVVRPILVPDYDTDISRRYQSFLSTESLTLKSRAVVAEALDRPEIQSLSWVSASEDPVGDVSRALQIKNVRDTNLLSVSMIGSHPEDMAVIVNGIVETYLRRREARRRAEEDDRLRSLRHERITLEAKLKAQREQMRQLAVQSGLTEQGVSGSAIEAWVGELQQLLAQAKREGAVAAAKLDALENANSVGELLKIDPAGFVSYLAQDPESQTLKNELRSIEFASLKDQRLGRGPGHPEVQTRPAMIAALGQRIQERTNELRDVYTASSLRELKSNRADAEVTTKFIETELNKAREQLVEERATTGGQRFVLEDLTHERARFEEDLNLIRQKMWSIELERNRTARVSLESPAHAPKKPNIDKRPKYAAVTFFFSFCLGAGVAMLRQRLDTCFRDPSDVVERLGVRVLGSVQQLPEPKQGIHDTDDPRIVEPMRGISAALLAASNNKKTHVRLITSPAPGSGKSSLSMNLARCLASTGRRVLLVDADNHGRGVTRRLALLKLPGLTELLWGSSSADELIRNIEWAHLHVLPAGSHDEKFGEILTRQEAHATLRSMFEAFDEVIIDSAPVLAGSSAVILATLADEVVLVLRAGESRADEATSAREYLASVGGNVVGVILNGVDEKSARYSYSYASAREEDNGQS